MVKRKRVGTIDITPTWSQATNLYLRAIEEGGSKGKESGREGIIDMAKKFDNVIKVLDLRKKGRVEKLRKVM